MGLTIYPLYTPVYKKLYVETSKNYYRIKRVGLNNKHTVQIKPKY